MGSASISVIVQAAGTAVAVAFWSSVAFAWGTEGHRIVAYIAEQYLELNTSHQVHALLAIENANSLADVANWADEIRTQRPETASWHFVDIPIQVPVYDPTRDCLRNDCIIAKLEQFAAQLSDQDLPDGQRLQALKFVVHFVGDLHQPLHVSDNDDRGGNEVHVTFNTKQTNLHAVWDTEILVPAVQGDERTYELLLVRSINSDDLPAFHGFSRTQPWLAVFNIILRAIEGSMAEHEGAHLGGRRAETGADSVARVPDH